MAFRFYEKTFVALFVLAGVASTVWWAATDSMIAGAAAIASVVLVLVSVILFLGSALERRGGEDHKQSFVEGAHFARDLMADGLHYWTQQQQAAGRTNAQLARNDGHMIKAQASTMAAMVKWAMSLADDMATAKAQAQAQPQDGYWYQAGEWSDGDAYDYAEDADADAWDPYSRGGR